jgi:hypothetical protein
MLRPSVSTGSEAPIVTREDSPERFAFLVLMAVGHCSTLTSPFVHTTRVARKW